MSDEQETEYEVAGEQTTWYVYCTDPKTGVRLRTKMQTDNPFVEGLHHARLDHASGKVNVFLARSAIIARCRFIPPEDQGRWHPLAPNEPQPPENDYD
jgi:hypothetical protein